MQTINIIERQSSPISREEFLNIDRLPSIQRLLEKKIISIGYSASGYTISGGSYVGLTRLSSGLFLRIGEKVPGAYAYLFYFAQSSDVRIVNAVGFYKQQFGDNSWLWLRKALWQRFLEAARSYLFSGLGVEYVKFKHISSTPRGRLLLRETAARYARGRRGQLVYLKNALSRETYLNGVIKAALKIVSASMGITEANSLAEEAGYLLYYLQDVKKSDDIYQKVRIYGVDLPSVREEYHDLAKLASVVISECAPELNEYEAVDLPLTSFTRMDDIFERALFNLVLSKSETLGLVNVERHGFGGQAALLFPDTGTFPTEPDIVLTSAKGHRILVDAKYRNLSPQDARDSIYQIISHCISYNATVGVIVSVTEESKSSIEILGTTPVGTKIIFCRVFIPDLESTVTEILSSIT